MPLPPQPVNQMGIAGSAVSGGNILPAKLRQILFDNPFLIYVDFFNAFIVIVD
ncbi:hypothetical protein D3C74_476430 [compost metagenome]